MAAPASVPVPRARERFAGLIRDPSCLSWDLVNLLHNYDVDVPDDDLKRIHWRPNRGHFEKDRLVEIVLEVSGVL